MRKLLLYLLLSLTLFHLQSCGTEGSNNSGVFTNTNNKTTTPTPTPTPTRTPEIDTDNPPAGPPRNR